MWLVFMWRDQKIFSSPENYGDWRYASCVSPRRPRAVAAACAQEARARGGKSGVVRPARAVVGRACNLEHPGARRAAKKIRVRIFRTRYFAR